MTALPEKTGTLTSDDGVKIFYRNYPAGSERARLVIAHGLGEHSGRYGNVVERMLLVDMGFQISCVTKHCLSRAVGAGISGGRAPTKR